MRRGNENGEPGDPDSPRKIFPGPDRGLFGLRDPETCFGIAYSAASFWALVSLAGVATDT
jgi:hypothetical protein